MMVIENDSEDEAFAKKLQEAFKDENSPAEDEELGRLICLVNGINPGQDLNDNGCGAFNWMVYSGRPARILRAALIDIGWTPPPDISKHDAA